MKLQKLILHNFRAYSHETIDFGNGLTCIVGKNDTGKSTILTALEWFFSEKQSNEYDINVNSSLYEDFYVEAFFSDITFPKYDLKIYLGDESERQDEFPFLSDLDFIQSLEISLRKYSNAKREILITCGGKKIDVEPLTFGGATIKRMCQSLYDAYCRDSSKCCIRTNDTIAKEDWWQWNNDNGDFYWSVFNFFKPNSSLEYYLNILFKQRFYEKTLEKQISSIKTSLSSDISNELIGIVPKKAMNFNSSINKINFFPNGSDLFFEINDSLFAQIPLANRGDGFQMQIKNTVCKLLAKNISKGSNVRCYIFAFEEPETHLHPKAQLKMYDTIKDLVKNPNYQVIITTHSPYIVKELAKDNIMPIVITRDEEKQTSYISKLDEKVLPYDSMNEINYIAFDEPSIAYHIELFGYLQNKLKKDAGGVDIWLFENKFAERKYDYYQVNSTTGELIQDVKHSGYQHSPKTLPYCVRNQIDHPNERNSQYDDKEKIQQSIEIMRNAIINNPNVFK
jgi:AAA15 family ATPase/GTPase